MPFFVQSFEKILWIRITSCSSFVASRPWSLHDFPAGARDDHWWCQYGTNSLSNLSLSNSSVPVWHQFFVQFIFNKFIGDSMAPILCQIQHSSLDFASLNQYKCWHQIKSINQTSKRPVETLIPFSRSFVTFCKSITDCIYRRTLIASKPSSILFQPYSCPT